MNRLANDRYSRDEVTRIIRRALQSKTRDEIRHAELLDIGQELGIDADSMEAAIEKEKSAQSRDQQIKAWRQSRKFGFHWHLWSYLITNGCLLLINSLVPGPWWFQWPLIGWGIGLAFHFQSVYLPNQRQIEEGFRKDQGAIEPS